MADTIVKLFLENAERNPKAPALLDIRGIYSYEEMNRRSAYLAEKILSAGGGKRVAVLLPRIKDFVVAMFAVLRSGGAVVPIDGEYPAERVRSILQDVNCALCFTTKARAGEIEEVPSLLLEEIFPEGEDVPEADLTLDLSNPDAEGYILYTSGSTGKPKGVVHRQSILSCAPTVFAGLIPMTEHSRALNIAGFSFIASLLDFTTMLSCGGSVYIASETERKNMETIHALFTKRKITGMFCPPQMYGVLQQLYGTPPLEYVILAGEKAQGTEYATGVLELYASSESFCALLHPAGSGGSTCLGKPCREVEVYLLDEEGRRIEEPGVVGELCISNPWLAIGYNKLPEETAQRFTENPFRPGTRLYHSGDQMAWDEDGNLIFYGRKDRMVKVRGYRVELGEIDQVMTRKASISESASVDVQVRGDTHIANYYTQDGQSPEELKEYAGRYLPDYMIPDYYIPLKELPRNDRGKIDLPRLRKMEIRTEEAEYEPPRTETERKICGAFASTLGLDRASATADFFDLGGTSLSAAVLISLLSDGKTSLSFQDVSANPTPRALAAFLESRRDAALPPMNRSSYPLTKTQLGIYLESLTGGSKETYTLPYLARAAEGVGPEELIRAVRQVLKAHPG
ncbi:MAG: non-ribosomal peptide synthetase, partial [Clostridia bacterium]|nr:non-ribosomal peptide synthetase [Clostridia bacterium]